MHGAEIAIIGMSGKFPEAKNTDEFWRNIVEEKESIQFLSEEEIQSLNNTSLTKDANYVPSLGGYLADTNQFDGEFFGYSPREMEIMDPQFRLFHEVVWEALEDAGYAEDSLRAGAGLYAGASGNTHWHQKLMQSDKYGNRAGLAGIQFVERDFLPTLVSYNLNLNGPSFNVQTACSTSLVAVHLACQAILNGECSIALAGGVSIANGTEKGYRYQEGSILSPDGHCRAFDAEAKGSIHGSGAGVVVLKLLEEAIEDKDHIYAVIKGSAINNDGNRKVGFTAPSVQGQSEVIRAAQQMAEVHPEQIQYIEAHGTGTPLGDPIEMEALKRAFASTKLHYCALGAIKTNIGHLDAAAGVAGLIKTAMACYKGVLPATLHYKTPNPKLGLEKSPFYIQSKTAPWKSDGLRYAGISSFGIGGTNAHVVVEQAPEIEKTPSKQRFFLLPFSAKNPTSLQQWLLRFGTQMISNSASLADVAYSLSVGRKAFEYRSFIVVEDKESLDQELEQNPEVVKIDKESNSTPNVVFLFPGQGAQYEKMGLGLYTHNTTFKNVMDQGFLLYNRLTNKGLKEIWLQTQKEEYNITDTAITQPLMFLLECALGAVLKENGVHPKVVLGHSVGEYAAAVMAGIFSFEDALKIVIKRGELIQSLPKGSMLSIAADFAKVNAYLQEGLDLAAVNSGAQCVVSGTPEAIETLKTQLDSEQIFAVLLDTSHAFHSYMMDPILDSFEKAFEGIAMHEPSLPIISNVSGGLARDGEMTSVEYWVSQIRKTVRFEQCAKEALSIPDALYLEVGPGNTLVSLLHHNSTTKKPRSINALPNKKQKIEADNFYLRTLGKLWQFGVPVALETLFETNERARIKLPTYAFAPTQIPEIESAIITEKQEQKQERNEPKDWYYREVWKQLDLDLQTEGRHKYLYFAQPEGFSVQMLSLLSEKEVIVVHQSNAYEKIADGLFHINPSNPDDFRLLLEEIEFHSWSASKIVFQWGEELFKAAASIENTLEFNDRSFNPVLNLVRAIGFQSPQVQLYLISNGAYKIIGGDIVNANGAYYKALAKVLPLEYKHIESHHIDVEQQPTDQTFSLLLQSLSLEKLPSVLAVRGAYYWEPMLEKLPVAQTSPSSGMLEYGKHYMVLGAGGMGVHIAAYLLDQWGSKVTLLHRSEIPENTTESNGTSSSENKKWKLLHSLRAQFADRLQLLQCDITQFESLEKAVVHAIHKTGNITGVIHAAGTIDNGGIIQRRDNASFDRHLAVKVNAVLHLDTIFKDRQLPFLMLFSSLGNHLYEEKYGELAYTIANEYLDLFVQCPSNIKNKYVLDWCDWQEVGMAMRAMDELFGQNKDEDVPSLELPDSSITPKEGVAVFEQVCALKKTSVMVFPTNLFKRIEQRDEALSDYSAFLEKKFQMLKAQDSSTSELSNYASIEEGVLEIWKNYLGYTDIDLNSNIFDLGASSLDVVQVNTLFQSQLNIHVPVTTLFEYPSITAFIAHIQAETDAPEAPKRSGQINKGVDKLGKLKKLSNRNK